MPTYLDFNTTKAFRDFLISKTLNRPNGPQTFTDTNYVVQNLNNFANVDPGDVKTNWSVYFGQNFINLYIPPNSTIEEYTNTSLPTLSQLNGGILSAGYINSFEPQTTNLVSIMAGQNFDDDSRLMKFATQNIRENKQGPVLARLQQNLESATLGRARILDALDGNIATAINIVTGREPLIEKNYKITVAKSLLGKGVDFLQTVAGIEFPFSEIPGDYLSNPRNPIVNRPTPKTEAGAILQDVTGVLGSLVGIQRRPKLGRKPSDLMVEYLGEGQKQILFDQLSYSTYAPNYTTTARSQQSSKLFNFANNVAGGIKNFLGLEAPKGVAYIGDDRAEDVKYTMSDFNDNMVKSSYFLSLMFDPVQAALFERQRNISQGGPISGKLTWISKNSKNKIGLWNEEFQSRESNDYNNSISTKYGFREDSILGKTQEILDSMPKDGQATRTHVGNVIDQTSRIFKEGDSMLSRGSAIKFVDKYKQETGAEYCRVWTKDRSYMNYSDTMKRTANIRKFDDSVMGGDSRPYNINIAPISSGNYDAKNSFKNSFGSKNSTNIFETPNGVGTGDGFYAKKYMFSIENLAWRTSNTPGFTYNDLPFCERGNNGGRVMWFPPYDLKISENNQARWQDNTFLGRPEPIYTYQDTSRSGQLSFKVVVDHPSILNLLVRELFKGMSEEESENYINAFFAGCKELDFYELIRRFTQLDTNDIKLIQSLLNQGQDPETIKQYKVTTEYPTETTPTNTTTQGNEADSKPVDEVIIKLKYENDRPGPSLDLDTTKNYTELYDDYKGQKQAYIDELGAALNTLTGLSQTDTQVKTEKSFIFGDANHVITQSDIDAQKTKIGDYFDQADVSFNKYVSSLNSLISDISGKTAETIRFQILSSCSSVATNDYNERLSLRRSHSVIQDIFDRLSAVGGKKEWQIKWPENLNLVNKDNSENDKEIIQQGQPIVILKEYNTKDFGFEHDTKIIVESVNYGETLTGTQPDKDCVNKDFVRVPKLKQYSPIAFYCRQTAMSLKYNNKSEKKQPDTPTPQPPITKIEENGQVVVNPPTRKPAIDPLKRIIAKTLSECFYFKKLEETDPIVFSSLKEKLKYFHPAFHSTTPEGLNARLTFLQQCIRPGDTIPIKGISEESDVRARNTAFGPPPVCVLRIGDFYHSKIVIRDVNISYDENVWDLNPEGIGVQPMIASVQLQVNFIGGQGIEKPVERLQNALSSNFYANTEMYDERSISTNTLIGGESTSGFTKSFLEDLQKINDVSPSAINDAGNSENTINGKYIGDFNQSTSGFTYTNIVKDLFKNTDDYFKKYPSSFNIIYKKYGPIITSVVFSENYRSIKNLEVNTNGVGGTRTISLMGLYREPKSLSSLIEKFLPVISTEIENQDITTMLNFDNVLKNSEIINKSNTLLKPFIKDYIKTELNNLVVSKEIKDLEDVRNKLISSVDKLNYIVKNGYDSKLDKKENTKANLSGFTSNLLYDEYDHCLDYIEKNQPKLNDYDDNSIDFNSPTISLSTLKYILQVLLKEQKQNILKLYEVDKTLFTTSDLEKMGNKFDKFIETIKEKKFKNSNFKNRKNDKEISFGVSTFQPLTDSTATTEISKIMKKNKVPAENNKLNFYKP